MSGSGGKRQRAHDHRTAEATATPPTPIDSQKPAETIQAYLRDLIVSGRLRAGEWITLDEIAAQFGVSRTPVREAIAVLMDELMVRVQPRRGITPNPLSARDIEHTFAVYSVVNAMRMERAVSHITHPDILVLQRCCEEADTASNLADAYAASRRFHDVLYHVAGSPKLDRIAQALRRTMPSLEIFDLEDLAAQTSAHLHHLLDAVVARDPTVAVHEEKSYVARGAQRLIEQLRGSGLLDVCD